MVAYWWMFVALGTGFSLGVMMMAMMFLASAQPDDEPESVRSGTPIEPAAMT